MQQLLVIERKFDILSDRNIAIQIVKLGRVLDYYDMYDKNATAIITEVQPPSSVLLGSTASGDIIPVYCRDSNDIREGEG